MRARLVTALMLVIGAIHLLPIAGLLGTETLNALYEININSSDLDILMRHRAVLFGLLGGFFCYAAFKPGFQPVAFLISGISVVSFLALCLLAGHVNAALLKVAIADAIALVCLAVAVVLYYKPTSSSMLEND